jgi:hypothetical protein
MSIEFKEREVTFRGVASVEDAEQLLDWLQKNPTAAVQLESCSHLHTANLQVLMAAHPRIASWPESPDLRAWLETALKSEL